MNTLESSPLEYARKHKFIPKSANSYSKSIPNASQMKSTSLHLINISLKNEPLHVARGPVFSATDDILSVTGRVFEAPGRGAAPEC